MSVTSILSLEVITMFSSQVGLGNWCITREGRSERGAWRMVAEKAEERREVETKRFRGEKYMMIFVIY